MSEVKEIDEIKEINERLNVLRTDLKMSQTEFGNKLMISCSSISKIEKGEREVTDRISSQICDVFNVRKEWLVNGSGSMYKEIDDNMIANMMGKVFADGDDFLKKVFLTFANLSESERQVVKKIINQLSEKK